MQAALRLVFGFSLWLTVSAGSLWAQAEAEAGGQLHFQHQKRERMKIEVKNGSILKYQHPHPAVRIKGRVVAVTDSTITLRRDVDQGLTVLDLAKTEAIWFIDRKKRKTGWTLLLTIQLTWYLVLALLLILATNVSFFVVGLLILFYVLSLLSYVTWLIALSLILTGRKKIRLRDWKWRLQYRN